MQAPDSSMPFLTEAVLIELHGAQLKHPCQEALWVWGLSSSVSVFVPGPVEPEVAMHPTSFHWKQANSIRRRS